MERSPVHSKNALLPIISRLAGMVMAVKPLHPSNADLPIDLTPSGITIDSSPLHDLKALYLMLVTLSGITVLEHARSNLFVAVSIIALQLSRES